MSASWAKLPAELRSRPQWCIAGADKAPLTVTSEGKLVYAKVNEPGTWLDFNTAALAAYNHKLGIGYVLHEDDPFSCIDLDVKDVQNAPDKPKTWTTQEQFDLYYRIMQSFDSYTESSQSGKGLHVWLKGKIGAGFKRDGVEVYSQERFIISTGNIVLERPLQEAAEKLNQMVGQMRPKQIGDDLILEELPELEGDWYVLERALAAANGEKFETLWKGNWRDLNFPSQSEADLALMSMFTFYSPSNEQCRRLFRDSGLGKREKALKNNDYLNRTLRLVRAREKRESSVDLSAISKSIDLAYEMEQSRLAAEELARLQGAATVTQPRTVQPLQAAGPTPPTLTPATSASVALAGPVAPAVAAASTDGMPWPPGIAGRIAHFIYQSANRSVKEVAIVSALGLLAGICGKGWHIPQSGLNMYIILVARSAIGKETMHSGISAIVKAVTEKLPIFHNYVSFDQFVSGPALTKACAQHQAFINVAGEFGRTLKRMANDDGRDSAMSSLRTVMTNLYQKSGPQAIVGGMRYSSSDNNVASVSGVAYSMIGETTPRTFYDALTETMMEDGFLSRFLIIEYNGDRPPENPNQVLVPDDALIDTIRNIAYSAEQVNQQRQSSMPVQRTEEAAWIMNQFEQECDHEINSTKDESYRQMWNRASLKAKRLAAILAVGDHHLHPTINREHIVWAIECIRRDIAIMRKRLETGDVGMSDSTRERKLASIITAYMSKTLPKTHAHLEHMQKVGVVPRNYLQTYTAQSSAFFNFKGGSTRALDFTLQSFLDNGNLVEIPRDKVVANHQFHGKAYRIVHIPEHKERDE